MVVQLRQLCKGVRVCCKRCPEILYRRLVRCFIRLLGISTVAHLCFRGLRFLLEVVRLLPVLLEAVPYSIRDWDFLPRVILHREGVGPK